MPGPAMFLDFAALIGLLVGLPLLLMGVKTWRTNTEKSWLVRSFALFFTTFATLLLAGAAGLFIGWW